MKKLSVIALAAGVLLILTGVFCKNLFFGEALCQYPWKNYAQQTKFTMLMFGSVTAICGLIGWIFNKKLVRLCSLKTTLIALAIAAVTSLGIHSGLSLLSCFFLTNPSRHPIRFPASAGLGLLCLSGFIFLMYVYYKMRKKERSVSGVVLDVLLGLVYCVSFYFICVTADNIISYLI